jgi:hypothetical protein
MTADSHALMENANDVDIASDQAVVNQMGSGRTFQIAISHIDGTALLGPGSQPFKRRDDFGMITVGLLR